jgi:hypothetical protein
MHSDGNKQGEKGEKIESPEKNNGLKLAAIEFIVLLGLLALFTYFGK